MSPSRAAAPLIACALLCCCLAACAPRQRPAPEPAPTHADVITAWVRFVRTWEIQPPQPGVYVKASLYYRREVRGNMRGNRTLLEIWGDFSRPLRLDVRAGVGTSLAHVREDAQGLLAYYPGTNRAYTHGEPALGARALGLPLPFSVKDLAHALMGSLKGLVPERFSRGRPVPGGGFEFRFETDPRIDALFLDAEGLPAQLTGTTLDALGRPGEAWSLTFDGYDRQHPGKPLPEKLTLALPGEETGVLRVKEREYREAPWPEKAMALPLPAETEFYDLETPLTPDIIFKDE
jgi:hypothetical protein